MYHLMQRCIFPVIVQYNFKISVLQHWLNIYTNHKISMILVVVLMNQTYYEWYEFDVNIVRNLYL